MTNPSTKSTPRTPHVKTNLTSEEWAKRGGSRAYTKRVKRMLNLLSSGEPQGRGERVRQAHYWLDANQVEDRRQRSPSERLADSKPTDSVKY